jgi:hypothetical protein
MEIDPFDERELYSQRVVNGGNASRSSNVISTTISTIVVHGGPLKLVIALLRVSNTYFYELFELANIAFHHSVSFGSRLFENKIELRHTLAEMRF